MLIIGIECVHEEQQDQSIIPNEMSYDEELAEELGADEYGMRRYVIVLLKTGPNRDHDEARKLTETDPAIQAGRLAMELHPRYGSAGLKMVTKFHSRISEEKP